MVCKSLVILIFSILVLPISGFSQISSNSGGSTMKTENYEVSFAVGQVVNANITDGQNFIDIGVIQPNSEIISSTNSLIDDSFKIYPNPAFSIINIESENGDLLSYDIYSSDSKLMSSGKINNEKIDVSSLEDGIYILRLKSSTDAYSAVIQKYKI